MLPFKALAFAIRVLSSCRCFERTDLFKSISISKYRTVYIRIDLLRLISVFVYLGITLVAHAFAVFIFIHLLIYVL